MPYRFFLLLLLTLHGATACGQDILYLRDGSKDTVTILLVGDTNITYKKYTHLQGPDYSIARSRVLLIHYADGHTQPINTGPQVRDAVMKKAENAVTAQMAPQPNRKNIISINVLNLVNGNLQLGYERLQWPWLGLKLSANIRVANTEVDLLRYRRKFTAGIDLNFYPHSGKKVQYFIGPAFRAGKVQNLDGFYYLIAPNIYDHAEGNFLYWALFLNNGILFRATSQFTVGIQAAVGRGSFSLQTSYRVPSGYKSTYSEIDAIFAINIGYRF